MRRAAFAIMLGAAATAGCSLIKAQPTPTTSTGTLEGVVTGPSGPVANAAVIVTAADATSHSGISNDAGYYAISGLPTGPASISIRASGFAPYDGSLVIIANPNRNEQNVSLNPQ